MIGCVLVVYGDMDKFKLGIIVVVIVRSVGVGENYKKFCLCDGIVIWELFNNDFVKV